MIKDLGFEYKTQLLNLTYMQPEAKHCLLIKLQLLKI